uniref:Cation-transporting ATPase n=1 Tax=Romanomermis culicivorax TaxID=13658 RepID=A0A915HJ83_ROMCU
MQNFRRHTWHFSSKNDDDGEADGDDETELSNLLTFSSREREDISASAEPGEEEEEGDSMESSRDHNGFYSRHWAKIQITDDDSRDFIQICGYKINWMKNFLCKLFYFLTLGLLRLLFHWKPEWHVKATCDQCSLKMADQVFIRDSNQETYLRKIFQLINPLNVKNGLNLILSDGSDVNLHTIRYFTLKKMKFLWYPAPLSSELPVNEGFHRMLDLDQNLPLSLYHRLASGWENFDLLDDIKVKSRAVIHGANEVMVKLVPIHMLLFKEKTDYMKGNLSKNKFFDGIVLSPFYCFQAFSVTVWYCELYYIYATIIILISLVSITLNIYLTRKNQRTLHEMMYSIDNVKVLRNDSSTKNPTVKEISSKELVVGDILLIPGDGCIMECDAVLISGSCVVDESMLTGESTPCTKVPLPNDETQFYSTKQHQSHTLFCGTKILLAKSDFTKNEKELCEDCTTGTPCCGYRSCNMSCCNCGGGCRGGNIKEVEKQHAYVETSETFRYWS